jgi:hypothetical protein
LPRITWSVAWRSSVCGAASPGRSGRSGPGDTPGPPPSSS